MIRIPAIAARKDIPAFMTPKNVSTILLLAALIAVSAGIAFAG